EARQRARQAEGGGGGGPGQAALAARQRSAAARGGAPTPFGDEGSAYAPTGFEEPSGSVLVPYALSFPHQIQLYALGLLRMMADEQVAARMRELAAGYHGVRLKTAAFRALAGIGGQENLKFLRTEAMERKDSYARLEEVVEEFQTRLAAMLALGAAEDTEFLPRILDVLHEQPPEKGSIANLEENYASLSAWWQMRLYTAASRCLTQICRRRQLFELTADSELQQQMVRRLVSLIDQPGPAHPQLTSSRGELQDQAVRALGRCASFYDEDVPVVMKRVLLSVQALESRPGGGRPGGPGFRPGPGGPRAPFAGGGPPVGGASQQAAGRESLRHALQDALIHMEVRGGGVDAAFQGVTHAVGEWRLGGPGNRLMQQMAAAPTPQYLELLDAVFGSLNAQTRLAILQALGKSELTDTLEYAQFAARVIKTMQPTEAPAAPQRADGLKIRIESALATARQARAATEVQVPSDRMEEAIALARSLGVAEVEVSEPGMLRLTALPRLPAPVRQAATPAAEGGAEERRRAREWSYAIEGRQEVSARQEARWSLVDLFLKSGASAVAAAFNLESLADVPEIGPALAARCVEVAPSLQEEVVKQLGELLLAPTESRLQEEVVTVTTKRAAVSALRRIGGEQAAQALFIGLVGRLGGQEAPGAQRPAGARGPGGRGPGGPPAGVGPPGRVGPPFGGGAPVSGGPRPGQAPGGPVAAAGGAAPQPLTSYIARALGSMGRDDLLQAALAAPGHAHFDSGPAAIQSAALEGMAYLPAELEPARRLEEMIEQAPSRHLRTAAAEALATVLRRGSAS
ncbi:MAG: hypothetical protein ACYS1C_10385, partial [Planctomycetota bacterium]